MVARHMALAGLALLASTGPAMAETVADVARRYDFSGELLVGRNSRVQQAAFGTIAPGGGQRHRVGQRWRLASITKQITAARLVERHSAYLDNPLPGGSLTLRQLLTHRANLQNPDDSPAGAGGVPSFYLSARPDLAFCASTVTAAAGPFRYNNCDYIHAAAVLGMPRWPQGMAMARVGEMGVPGFVHGVPEARIEPASFGAGGGLVGTVHALWRFDRTLMAAPARTVLWQPEGEGSYAALGAWVFPGTLKGCKGAHRIVQRDGEIQGVQARNFILPDDDVVVIAFTNRASDDFAFGEIWQQSGFAYDLLSSVVCTGPRSSHQRAAVLHRAGGGVEDRAG